jgi:hypothetical protein
MMRFLFVLFFVSACTAKDESKTFSPQGLNITGLDGFREISKRNFKIKQSEAEEVRISKDRLEVTLRSVNDARIESFSKSVELREFELGRPFRSERSPYPGAVTDDVQCPGEFRPRLFKSSGPNRWFWRAEIYASSRKTQVCNEADFMLKSVEVITYCPSSKKLFTVHAYWPKSETKIDWATWVGTASCKD